MKILEVNTFVIFFITSSTVAVHTLLEFVVESFNGGQALLFSMLSFFIHDIYYLLIFY